MNIKKEYLIGGLIVVGVALYLISQGDGVLNSASNNKGGEFENFSGEDDSYADMAVENVFPSTRPLNLNNLKK
jgi:hypothetical protein